jgi:hypothetical protein
MTNFRFSVGVACLFSVPLCVGLGACAAEPPDGAADEVVGSDTQPFVSFPPVNLPRTSKNDCDRQPPIGREPRCAHAVWYSGPMRCTIEGLEAATCACYEGETRSCLFSSPDTLCWPPSADCGVRWCNVTDHTHSTWGACQ